jgi:hypothetical protein
MGEEVTKNREKGQGPNRPSLSLGRLEGGSVALRLSAPTGPAFKNIRKIRFAFDKKFVVVFFIITPVFQHQQCDLFFLSREEVESLRGAQCSVGVRMMSVVSLLASLLLVTSQAVTAQSQLIGSDDGTNQQSGNRCIDDEQNPQVKNQI